ncbi:hypothetical protein CK510_29520 [Brunnivagina elsteri CCALA 953]|uniref:Uncharacterized protein n=1 Tax=Brunnivagina elsteri CCALA 953 TaxID=987040 RepID=A0A2A2TAA1_9CYAN|nr:hypothetical protein CK510_29520 [Calothrix elsteri CCALA 953]
MRILKEGKNIILKGEMKKSHSSESRNQNNRIPAVRYSQYNSQFAVPAIAGSKLRNSQWGLELGYVLIYTP